MMPSQPPLPATCRVRPSSSWPPLTSRRREWVHFRRSKSASLHICFVATSSSSKYRTPSKCNASPTDYEIKQLSWRQLSSITGLECRFSTFKPGKNQLGCEGLCHDPVHWTCFLLATLFHVYEQYTLAEEQSFPGRRKSSAISCELLHDDTKSDWLISEH